jgi:hypothetical protein
MALLDFIKNRQQQPTEQAPAKQEPPATITLVLLRKTRRR